MSSVERALDILELLATKETKGVRDIARGLDIPPSTTLRILKDMEKSGYIEQNNEGKFSITAKILHLANVRLKSLQLPNIALPYLEKLAQLSEATAFLAVTRNDGIVYLSQVQSKVTLQLNVEIGTIRPMHCTGLGKALLANLSHEEAFEILSKPLIRFTENTITDKELLKLELEKIRFQGFAIDNEEIIPGCMCIATPIFDINRRAVAAISIAGVKEKFSEPFIHEFTTIIKKMAALISEQLGFESKTPV